MARAKKDRNKRKQWSSFRSIRREHVSHGTAGRHWCLALMLLGSRRTCLVWLCPGGFLLESHPLWCTNKKRGGYSSETCRRVLLQRSVPVLTSQVVDKTHNSPKAMYQSNLMPPWAHGTVQSPPPWHWLWTQMSQTQKSLIFSEGSEPKSSLILHCAFSSISAGAKSQLPALLSLVESGSLSVFCRGSLFDVF